MARYEHDLDNVGNRTLITETLLVPNLAANAYLESDGLVAMEAEHYSQALTSTTHAWLTDTVHSGYTGTAYTTTDRGNQRITPFPHPLSCFGGNWPPTPSPTPTWKVRA